MKLPPRLRPRKTPAQQRSRALVDAVLEAGSRVLIKQGYERLTMSAVAARAGVSVGSLYQYFPNKESLVAALVEQRSQAEADFIGQQLAQLTAAEPNAASPAFDLEHVILYAVRASLEFRAGAPALHAALLDSIAYIGRHPLLVARGEHVGSQLRALLEPHYTTLRQADPALPPLEHTLFVLSNAIHSLTHEGLVRRPEDMSDEALAQAVTRLVTGYLR